MGALLEWHGSNLLAVDASNGEVAQTIADYLQAREGAGSQLTVRSDSRPRRRTDPSWWESSSPRCAVTRPHTGARRSAAALLRMLELRRVLEGLAVELACERTRAEDGAAMRDMVESLTSDAFDLRSYAETVKGTHDLIVTAAHNEYLADAMALPRPLR
ncbi:MAG: transcriptional regulator, GntR family [Mycobacterium sp.]|nr:transcriptional regulator, GntR family [Mycobacterium sp.]